MDVIGLIAEYNPFHYGHLYHIKKIKERYPDSLLILVLNGYFLERGEISLLSKEDKTKLSLEYGIDLVLELPFLYGTQSADVFSEKAVFILQQFGVQRMIIGSECNDVFLLKKLAQKQLESGFQEKVKENLKTGMNYPTALASSIEEDMDYTPNDLLGISYAKAILKEHYPIQLETIKRTSDYHDLQSEKKIISASNIRHKLEQKQEITKYIPQETLSFLKEIQKDLCFKFLQYKIMTEDHLNRYLDVDEGIESRLKEMINKSTSMNDFILRVKTKRYTYNRIQRMLIHILIGVTKEKNDASTLSYIRVLGFNSRGRQYLNSIKKTFTISLQVDKNSQVYLYEQRASFFYDLITKSSTCDFERKNKPIVFDKE